MLHYEAIAYVGYNLRSSSVLYLSNYLLQPSLRDDVHVAEMALFEVINEFASFDGRKDEGLAAAGETRHFVDADSHGLDGNATETEIRKNQYAKYGVHCQEAAGCHKGEGEFRSRLCEPKEENNDGWHHGHVCRV